MTALCQLCHPRRGIAGTTDHRLGSDVLATDDVLTCLAEPWKRRI
jgi:hypothetical protein